MLIRRYIACLIVMMTVVFKTSAQFEHILPKPDTAGVNELISEAVRMVLARQYDSAYSIYQFSFQLSRQIHYNTGIIRSLNGLGNVEGEQGKFQKSVY